MSDNFSNFTLNMRDIDKFELMCVRVGELTEMLSKSEESREVLMRELRMLRDEEKYERETLEARHEREKTELLKEISDLKKQLSQALQMRSKNEAKVEELLTLVKALKIADAQNRVKLYGGGKSETISSIIKKRKKKDEDRDDEENRFDGTSGSVNTDSSGDGDNVKNSGDLLKKVERDIKRKCRNADIEIIRTDYSKSESYSENVTFHSLEEYFTLSEGERFVKRDGEIEKTYLKIIIRYPERIEEHVYECATVVSKDAEDYKTSEVLDIINKINNSLFDNEMMSYILDEKYNRSKPYNQINEQLREAGLRMSNSTFVDNVHRVLGFLTEKMVEVWDKTIRKANYWMIDESPILVACKEEDESGDTTKKYKKRYIWCIRANKLKLVHFIYEGGRGAEVIEPYLKDFIGFYTTDGYQVYKIFDETGDEIKMNRRERRRRAACLTHIRRYFVEALSENFEMAMWFIDQIGKMFETEYYCKKNKLTGELRLLERLKKGSTATIMERIENRLREYEATGYVGCGPMMTKALRYAINEWSAMKNVLESGDVELSNNLSEQMMRRIKMNLKTATNIGSEESAKHNAFIFSLIESCKLNNIAPKKYIKFLLDNLRRGNQTEEELEKLLPCNCALACA